MDKVIDLHGTVSKHTHTHILEEERNEKLSHLQTSSNRFSSK